MVVKLMEMPGPALTIKAGVTTGSQRCDEWCVCVWHTGEGLYTVCVSLFLFQLPDSFFGRALFDSTLIRRNELYQVRQKLEICSLTPVRPTKTVIRDTLQQNCTVNYVKHICYWRTNLLLAGFLQLAVVETTSLIISHYPPTVLQ